jgi:hypothetical protein
MNFDKFGGRRYILVWGALIIASVLQWFEKLDIAGTAWGLAVGATVGAYIAGNVAQRKHEAENK